MIGAGGPVKHCPIAMTMDNNIFIAEQTCVMWGVIFWIALDVRVTDPDLQNLYARGNSRHHNCLRIQTDCCSQAHSACVPNPNPPRPLSTCPQPSPNNRPVTLIKIAPSRCPPRGPGPRPRPAPPTSWRSPRPRNPSAASRTSCPSWPPGRCTTRSTIPC